ncbi:MAG: hypothetical protein WD749_06160 [Phycisphaerales bacterium]
MARTAAGQGGGWAALVLAGLVGVTVGIPGLAVVARVAWAVVSAPGEAGRAARVDLGLLARTLLVAAAIAALATLLGWPGAWAARRLPSRFVALLALPLLLPSYLISSGWGLLRAPGAAIGDRLMSPGREWMVIPVGQGLAIAGLALWASPLASLLIASQLRRTDEDVYEALRLLPASRGRRALAILGMARPGVLMAFGAVLLLMLGSAVPLHVSQLDTYAITLWRRLDESARAAHWRVWVAAWPLLLAPAAAAWAVTARLRAESTEGARLGQAEDPRIRASPVLAGAALVWSLAVLAPVALFLLNLRGLSVLQVFWRTAWRSILASSVTSAATALVAAVIAGSMWAALAGGAPARRTARACLGALLVAGLSPGILVGLATAEAWRAWPALAPIADSPAVIVLAHTARFGFLAALAGWWLARTEPRELRDLRRLEAGDSLRGWLRGALPPQAGVLAGVAAATGLLSFHEIEAAVMLQPPSSIGGGFAWLMLQQLHFARTQELAAGMVYVVGGGLVAGLLAVWLLGGRR